VRALERCGGITVSGLREHYRAVQLVIEALCAVCVVVAVVAAARGQALWAVLFAALAFGCYEAASEVDR
jgi:hypothetical protein